MDYTILNPSISRKGFAQFLVASGVTFKYVDTDDETGNYLVVGASEDPNPFWTDFIQDQQQRAVRIQNIQEDAKQALRNIKQKPRAQRTDTEKILLALGIISFSEDM
jgi:hypothetical protein